MRSFLTLHWLSFVVATVFFFDQQSMLLLKLRIWLCICAFRKIMSLISQVLFWANYDWWSLILNWMVRICRQNYLTCCASSCFICMCEVSNSEIILSQLKFCSPKLWSAQNHETLCLSCIPKACSGICNLLLFLESLLYVMNILKMCHAVPSLGKF